jgi:hypothetical protein
MNGLTGMIMGSGRVNLLSGWIWLNGSDLAPLHGARPRIRWAAVTVGWAAPKIRPKSRIQIRNPFSFSNIFYKLQINLNFNDFYSHNKIQEHFITPRKICNGMNATNNYLFKYLTL